MPKRLTQRDIEAILPTNGFKLQRQSRSHRVFHNFGTGKTTVVPAHDKAVFIGTLAKIIRQSGLPRDLFQ